MKKLIVDTETGKDVWDLQRSRKYSHRTARQSGLPLKEFLTAFSRRELAAPDRSMKEPDKVPVGFRVIPGRDKQAWARIERAAEFDEITPELFIWKAVCSMVECAEEDMILHPKTRRPIGSACELRESALVFQSVAPLPQETAREHGT